MPDADLDFLIQRLEPGTPVRILTRAPVAATP